MALSAGVDEAGRGPWAGPVVAAAVILPENHSIDGLRDSKKLSAKRRSELYSLILENAVTIGTGIVSHRIIDRINILQATFKAMQIALGRCRPAPGSALIDGHGLPNQIIPNRGIVGGDTKVDSIKAASIIAKVTRDRMMESYDIIFPEYGFGRHKGYGTSKHREMLEKYKATPIHRLSYKPVIANLPSLSWYRKQRRIGWLGERLAALQMMEKGHQIIGMNHYCGKNGEIDVISRFENGLVFTEVKTVSVEHNPPPEVKFDKIKATHIERSVNHFVQKEGWQGAIRLDLITVDVSSGKPDLKHYEGLSLD